MLHRKVFHVKEEEEFNLGSFGEITVSPDAAARSLLLNPLASLAESLPALVLLWDREPRNSLASCSH